MKLLVFTPLHPRYGARPQTWQSVRQAIAAYGGPVDWVISSGDNPHDEPYDNVTAQHNKARQMVLDGGYDAMLSIEADMVVPEHTIEALLSVDADIVYGVYVWRNKNMRRWSAYTELSLFGGFSIVRHPDRARAAWGQVVDVAGLGMGCTLIRRNVLEALPFRLYDGNPDQWIVDELARQSARLGIEIDPYRERKGMFCDDWMLALDADHYGFTQKAHLGVACGHIDNDGSIVWPHPAPGDLHYVERSNGLRNGG